MDDLISRKMVLALPRNKVRSLRTQEVVEETINVTDIEHLPSAQPEPSTEIQEILNYLDTTLHPIVSPDNWNVYAELHDMVSKLPSEQPEIIYCKKCKHWTETCGDKQWGLGDCDVFDKHLVMCNGYCAWAERREDEL